MFENSTILGSVSKFKNTSDEKTDCFRLPFSFLFVCEFCSNFNLYESKIMKLKIIFTLILSINGCLFSQVVIPPCVPSVGGTPATDEPPGCYLCGPIYAGTTHGFTPDSITFDFPCGTIENSQWITLETGASGTMEVTILSTGCKKNRGVEMAIYDSDFNLVSNCFSPPDTSLPGNIVASGLIPGDLYQLMIDGVDGDSCNILVTRTAGSHPGGWNPYIWKKRSAFYCVNSEIDFSSGLVTSTYSYEWKVDSTAEIVSGQGTRNTKIKWLTPGKKYIEARIFASCVISPIVIKDSIEIIDTIPFFNKTEFVCAGEMLPPKDTIQLANGLGCPFFQIRAFEQFTPSPATIVERLCFGKTFNIPEANLEFDSSGIYDLILPNIGQYGCDSIMNLTLEIGSPILENLTCQSFENRVQVTWKKNEFATHYRVYVNNRLVVNTTNLFFNQYNLGADSTVNIKVLPIVNGDAECLFFPDSIDCSSLPTSSTHNFSLSENVTLLPNPTSGKVQITSPTFVEWVSVFDISGREIQHSTKVEIDLSKQAPGIYFFKIKTQNGFIAKRVILF